MFAVECPRCGCVSTICPECGKQFEHGEASHCDEPACVAVNAPLDCVGCGRVVADSLKGVIGFAGDFHPYAPPPFPWSEA